MTTLIRLTLDTRRKKADDTYPIVFRINHNRVQTTIKTNYSVKKKYWCAKTLTIKKGSKYKNKTSNINQTLKQREADMNGVIIDIDNNNELNNLSVAELLLKLKHKKNENHTFVGFAKTIIADFRQNGKIGNANAYQNTINFLLKYKSDVEFNAITCNLLQSIENKYMSNANNHYNGLSVYMRTIRAIYNRAIAAGIANINNYPFKQRSSDNNKYKIKNEKTRKRAINKEHIQLIENYTPPPNAAELLINARLIFLFSFYMRGINLIDIAYMKVNNIVNGVLIFKRSKTSRTYEIKIGTKANEILEYFGVSRKKANDFIFPLVKRPGNPELMLADVRNATKNTNKYLKKIAAELGIPINLTTYVSRHSWATIADKAGVDRRIISKGLGHADLKTTEIYIDDLISSDDLEAADDIITG